MPLDNIRHNTPEPSAEADSELFIVPTPAKFSDLDFTAKGESRARVPFSRYETLWFNTGTLCNIACKGCYIESSPRNDRLAYLSQEEVRSFLDEAIELPDRPSEIGFTGGEPFLNPHFMGILEDTLERGFRALILTNAMKPMQLKKQQLLDLHRLHPGQIAIRVSLDHFTSERHERVRGARTWRPAMTGLAWLSEHGFDLAIAGRLLWQQEESEIRAGYGRLFASIGLKIDPADRSRLVLFPEMDEEKDVPEISEGCWSILGKTPADVMCSSSRMVIKRKDDDSPAVVACTLLPHDRAFEMGRSLADATSAVKLNHRHCARFCVLGGASCSTKT